MKNANSGLGGLGWGLRFCIPSEFSGDAGATLTGKLLEKNMDSILSFHLHACTDTHSLLLAKERHMEREMLDLAENKRREERNVFTYR